MKYDSIADLFTAKDFFRQQLLETVAEISDVEVLARPDDEKWTIRDVVEHLAMVDQGISRICRKLIAEAKSQGRSADGTLPISAEFWERSSSIAYERVEAPAQVQPVGKMPVRDSLDKLHESLQDLRAMRGDFEAFDLSEPRFPHPYFGPINAVEWLVIAGGHEHRHTEQIRRIIEKIRQ